MVADNKWTSISIDGEIGCLFVEDIGFPEPTVNIESDILLHHVIII